MSAKPRSQSFPTGINNAVPNTGLTYTEAKKQLGLRNDEKTLLFFGAIKPYKGLEYLVAAFQTLAPVQPDIRLIIAGERKKGHEQYWSAIQQRIDTDPSRDRVTQKIGFIPDDETELYFKAADVAVLPYTEIFQSGILFLAYSFGLPVIATDVGSFAEDIVEDKTGCICKPRDPDALAAAIQNYFNGALFRELEHRRQEFGVHMFKALVDGGWRHHTARICGPACSAAITGLQRNRPDASSAAAAERWSCRAPRNRPSPACRMSRSKST